MWSRFARRICFLFAAYIIFQAVMSSNSALSQVQDAVAAYFDNGARIDELRSFIASQPPETFQNSPWALTAAIEDFANSHGHLMIFRDAKMQIARRALESIPVTPRVIVEFGTFVGNSALAWGATMQSLHGGKEEAVARGCRVYTFELDEKLVGVSREFVRLAGLEELVTVVQGPAAESLRDLYEDGSIKAGGVDVVFFDHWEKYYLSDLKLCETLGVLHEGSLVIADNTDMPGAPDYLAYVRAQSRYNSKAIPSTEERGVPNYVEVSTVVEA